MTYTVTLGTGPELDAEERRQRAIRARGVLEGAGWLFDEYISDVTRDLLSTAPGDTAVREKLWQQADAAAQLKGNLLKIIQIQEAEDTRNERRHRREQPADHE